MKENREQELAVNSFTSDVAIFNKLDGIAGTNERETYERQVFLSQYRQCNTIMISMHLCAYQRAGCKDAFTLPFTDNFVLVQVHL